LFFSEFGWLLLRLLRHGFFIIIDDVKTPSYLNPQEIVRISENRLPHWEQDDGTYFLSFRLADSLPRHLLSQWKEERQKWLAHHSEPWSEEEQREFRELFSRRREHWLDQGYGQCLLRSPAVREAVLRKICQASADQIIWSLVLMPNHVHALVSVFDEREGSLGKLLRRWKGASARAVNEMRKTRGGVWAKDYFDRLIRDSAHLQNCARYIRRNPVKAGLSQADFTLHEHPYVTEILEL
jgi:putative transposase